VRRKGRKKGWRKRVKQNEQKMVNNALTSTGKIVGTQNSKDFHKCYRWTKKEEWRSFKICLGGFLSVGASKKILPIFLKQASSIPTRGEECFPNRPPKWPKWPGLNEEQQFLI
jgi:hypothetical protein